MVAANNGASMNPRNDAVDWTPLFMSMIAGMSTCLGAVWVFCKKAEPPTRGAGSRHHHRSSAQVIHPSTMSFSLALAGAVMVTVSVVSIIPECLRAAAVDKEEVNNPNNSKDEYKMIPIFSWVFLYRLGFHILGYILYFLLAKFAFPEPDEILGLHHQNNGYSAEEKQELEVILMKNTEELSTVSRLSSMESGIESLDESTPPPSKKDPLSEKARLRRNNNNNDSHKIKLARSFSGETGIKSMTSRSLAKGQSASTNGDSQKTAEEADNESDGEKPDNSITKKAECLQRLTRYSSGADLESSESKRAWRVAMLLFLSLAVHNFPEGLAVAASAMKTPQLGIKVTIGIMIHNIPEGIAIAVPCIAARPDSPWLAFWLSALSGLAEPFGAFFAIFVLRNFDDGSQQQHPIVNMENVLAFVAGIMIMVAVAELFPEGWRHTHEGKLPFVGGLVCGCVLMIATELYLD